MNRKEITEIKNTLKKIEGCTLTRIAGCYVNQEQTKLLSFEHNLLTLDEEEIYKYLSIFQKSLSGKIGEKLINLSIRTHSEGTGFHKTMNDLKNCSIKDERIRENLYDTIIANYSFKDSYLILIGYGSYDIPGGLESEYVYNYMITTICPVKLSKQGLAYSKEKNVIQNRVRDWVVQNPSDAILFPAFNDRSPDIHSYLYFTKNNAKLPHEFIDEIMGCEQELTSNSQKNILNSLISDTFKRDCSLDVVKKIHTKIDEISKEQKGDKDEQQLSKNDIQRIFEQCGANYEQINEFNKSYNSKVGNSTLKTQSFTRPKNITLKSNSYSVKIDSSRDDIYKITNIQGNNCLILKLEDKINIDGIDICK